MWSREDRRTLVLLLPLLVLAVAVFLLLEPRASHDTAPAAAAPEAAAAELFEFDPNTVDYRALRRLGFSKQDAAGVLRYRAAGKVFRIAEDFAACYQVSDSMYDRLEPYLRIGAEYVSGPAATVRNVCAKSVPNAANGSWRRSCRSASTR